MITHIDKLDGSGLRIRTVWGGWIVLDEKEVERLCAVLPSMFPQHFAARAAPAPAATDPVHEAEVPRG